MEKLNYGFNQEVECEEEKCEKCGHDEFKLFRGVVDGYQLFAKCVKCGNVEMKAG